MQQCPECGYPFPSESLIVANAQLEFNETKPYSPISSNAWFFKTPLFLRNFPRGKFAENHPFLGWLFGPFHIAKNDNTADDEYYDVINNIFLLWNISAKAGFYSVLWTILKIWWIVGLGIVLIAICFENWLYEVGVIVIAFLWVLFIVEAICGSCASYHRYSPIFIKTFRRIRKRHWISMYKAVKNDNLNLD